ncbi:membrane protein insertion efficiency factor [Seminavis robusta]|uniref:Membrane protein insertion efficiency factor n=1 Tax=Seminavis robusta TaxID=568900 RepID=A0A9N8HE57_9STRA|nr:membrane protein insertion efficiency factor [Seminavis robusta]|eukprot:Sro390_g132790.1 membrane protein insertion efficiency factor (227) ;mRNA; f:19682-20362
MGHQLMMILPVLLVSVLCCMLADVSDAACQSCVFLSAHHHHRKSSMALWGRVSGVVAQSAIRIPTLRGFAVHNLYQSVRSKPVIAAAAFGVTATCFVPRVVHRRHHYSRVLASDSSKDTTADDEETTPQDAESDSDASTSKPSAPVSDSMISALGFYKSFISPLLPPACRFVPTCSQYGVQAIKEFGPGKGAVLISWRLLRCSPFGGKGFDPPQWPPVSYTYGSWS